MRHIAERHLDQQSNEKLINRSLQNALLFGLASAALYLLLYHFSDQVRDLAILTTKGDKALFFVPILIALVFSFVHGAFTSHFWDSLGFKAKKK